ncbi:hypothetical protein CGRA01v4_00492 [Colletotrichum graminicola]|uniref:Methyltransferase domain-containing protein n=1 Tax=Colletotrichum graminicola (strain M1.001 / M2 / FGSC 10212) TaxID=645133 RepID=E3QQ87_COLGM|nr:uncharacterized protein GLRG_08169 [Colletotrichum graminicola M1.001]EFQ33025.1 hypothetical protein GLRG_08169 [Colletotrichum graminicola M1.001]WDK09214.1 hypothetical protein CGRA01v4_00492 [Colletotrichum graminicola]
MINSFNFHPEFWRGLFLGLFGSLLAVFSIVALVALKFLQNGVYDNDHWKLNVKVPSTTMWMNMGYWTGDDGQRIRDFQQACRALLHQVLAEAGVLRGEHPTRRLAVLDLGIGCGDQSLELARLVRQSSWDEYRYVGLTLNPSQFRIALEKPFRASQEPGGPDESIQVFQADAARPDTWGPGVKSATTSLTDARPGGQARWVLALDSLYHFFPDRRRILEYAAREFDASFMAFDLLLSDTASGRQKLLVKLLGLAMGCPVGAFVTETEYKKQLDEAGYDGRHVRFRDVTDDVFSGLVDHIRAQEEALRPFGISMAKFKVAGKFFDWFAKSNVLRATVVVAQRKPKRL